MSSQYETESSLGQVVFGHAQLGDQRRNARLVATFDQMRQHPGGTLPEKLASPADLRAFYRLCDCEDVTHAAVITAARQHTLTQVAACQGPVLVLHDATELDYTSLASLAGDLGQIGKGSRRGYVCQNVLAVEAESGDVLGLLDQILHHRDEVPADESLTEHRERKTRESRLWIQGTEHLPYERRWIVEEYHKAKKTGCQIEDMQFTTIARLEPAIALLSIVALTLLNLREASRRPDAKTRRATTILATEYVEVLSIWRYRAITTLSRLPQGKRTAWHERRTAR